MRSLRGRSQRSSGAMQTTALTQTAASVSTTGNVSSLWIWSPPTQRRPAPGSLGWNTSWLASAMKTVSPGGSAPVINILFAAIHTFILNDTLNWSSSLTFSLNCSRTWLQQTFSEADKNGDGTLSIGELHQLLHKLNVNLPKQKVREMFQVRSYIRMDLTSHTFNSSPILCGYMATEHNSHCVTQPHDLTCELTGGLLQSTCQYTHSSNANMTVFSRNCMAWSLSCIILSCMPVSMITFAWRGLYPSANNFHSNRINWWDISFKNKPLKFMVHPQGTENVSTKAQDSSCW